ncbi:MAG: glycosyltransferase family 2 protein [Clostridia bacterium]|nr:glycosyltransferase family 2 protein [Clostridia bacterium]
MNVQNDILVSVVIPTYKREAECLSKAINSVFAQTYKNTEIIVVDDSPSTYEKRNEVKIYISSLADKNVIYLQNEKNIGGSLTRNRGIEASHGKYITFLDDDDWYTPEKIETQLNFMIKNDCDASLSNTIMCKNGNPVEVRDFKDISAFDKKSLLHYHLLHHLTGTSTYMFKADKLRKIGGFDDALCGQEFILMLKAIEGDLKIRYMDVNHVFHTISSKGSISFSKNKIQGEKNLYKIKCRYFHELSKSEIRYIKFRYHAIMAIAYKRNSMYIQMIGEGLTAVATAPGVFLNECFSLLKNTLEQRKK